MISPLSQVDTVEETAAYICTKLKESGIDVVLSGGSCMEIYTHSNFSSWDIDFIASPSYKFKQIEQTMFSLGFKKVDKKYFKHDDNPNYIEFPSGPINLGNEAPKEFNELKTSVGTLILLSPTDCIKDRLCAYIYHQGNECLNHAIAVANLNEINQDNLIKWAISECTEIVEAVDLLLNKLKLLKKIPITNDDIKKYINKEANKNHINTQKQNELEELKDDLVDDYVIRQLLCIKSDEEYYPKISDFFKNFYN